MEHRIPDLAAFSCDPVEELAGLDLSAGEIAGRILAHDGPGLLDLARQKRDDGFGSIITYSRKVFVPLTHLCRDVCHYCTFAQAPAKAGTAYLKPDEVLKIARNGRAAGCAEVLFTLGDKPELRYAAARKALAELGYATTIEYLAAMCELVVRETGLLPHVNPGVLTAADIQSLRRFSVSAGIMLETSAARLGDRGQPHHGSPDKDPAVRLETIREAGRQRVAFTSGILIGIGETRAERIEALLKLRDLHVEYGHLQEIIIQNFRAKPGTKMAGHSEPMFQELRWTIAVARIIFGSRMSIQAPPNLSVLNYEELVKAGINDWGGVSPVTPDFVNPEAEWPAIEELRRRTAAVGKTLVERLALYPAYSRDAGTWVDKKLVPHVLRMSDSDGYARNDRWFPGTVAVQPELAPSLPRRGNAQKLNADDLLDAAQNGSLASEASIVSLFRARGEDVDAICQAADRLRKIVSGETVTYVVNRNINYTNICSYGCTFCAFSKGRRLDGRERPYDLKLDEVTRRAREAWARGATEVCMQGGIHPDYTGETYIEICESVRAQLPRMHIHAFSPLEVTQGAATSGLPIRDYLKRLKRAGLNSLPGTAAEILDDGVRNIIAPNKIMTNEWLHVVRTAHELGIATTSTIMFGHVEDIGSWARHLLLLRRTQQETGGFTEFVPLPFVHREAPIYLKHGSRLGPTFRETLLMHAVSRLVLHPLIKNIQVSWVKLGKAGVRACLQAGANDLGGTLMNESISRAAGTEHGQELPPQQMDELIRSVGRVPKQRSTLYGEALISQTIASYRAQPLEDMRFDPPRKRKAKPALATETCLAERS